MVNKKKGKRQQGPDDQNASDSTESCDESQVENAGGKCSHVPKGVDFPQVKKYLKLSGIQKECQECSKSAASDFNEEEVESQPGLWLCLRCGHQSCGRDRGQHALNHYQTPHSAPHPLVVNTELWQVWCYECNLEIPSTSKKKLHECLEFIKRQEDAPAKPAVNNAKLVKEEQEKTVSNAILRPYATSSGESKELPRVRGLRNNGNTCFFNAVLQCLAHTPFLLPVLEEMQEPGEQFTLPGGKPPGSEEELPSISGGLGKWGILTETLANTLSELRSGNADVFNPAPLLNKLMQKCPLFEGGDQHDSQELLRHLLEGVRTEDLKRYQTSILQLLGLSEKPAREKIEDQAKISVKFYGRQASDLSLRPDQVFRGSLVSTLECQDCLHVSQRSETFLDLSLPVMADKPQPPTALRRKSSEEALELSTPSKHQLKKEKKIARKGKKRQSGGGKNKSTENGEPTIDEENTIASGESEQSDADVEDNLEQDGPDGQTGKDVGESGYSSEKAANEDSAIESPVSQGVNGDSALTSPASPSCIGGRGSPIPLPYVESQSSVIVNMAEQVQEAEEVLFVVSDLATGQPVHQARLHFANSCNLDSPDIMNPVFDEVADLSMLSDHELVHLDQEYIHEKSSVSLNEELMIAIPSSPPSSCTKKGSPTSQGSLSPPSSDINLEFASPSLCLDPSSTSSPIPDLERPGSRFAFNAEDVTSRAVPGWVARFGKIYTKSDTNEVTSDKNLTYSNDVTSDKNLTYTTEVTSDENLTYTNEVTSDKNLTYANVDENLEGLNNLSLDLHSTNFKKNIQEIVLHDVSEEEVNKLLHELSTKSQNISNVEDINYSNISLNISNDSVTLTNESENVNGDDNAYGPFISGSLYKDDIVSHLNTVGEVKVGREKCVSNSATLSPKYMTDDGECSVMSCLNQFTSIELMTGNNKVGCEACTERHNQGKEGKMVTTNSTKQFLISSPPPVLILHLKRFQLQRSLLKKMGRHVSFPRVLDLAPLISTKSKDNTMVPSGQRQVLYSLYGIVEHSGTLQYGHYIAYVKVRAPLGPTDPRWRFIRPDKTDQEEASRPPSEPQGKWYCVSDSRVNEVSEDKVMRSEAYLLFYERIW